jgi:hypothetical protein
VSRDALAHQESSCRVDNDDSRRNRARLRRFRRVTAERNGQIHPAPALTPRFLQHVWSWKHGGAPGLLHGHRGDLHRRRTSSTGARVSGVACRDERGRRTKEPRVHSRRRHPFYSQRRSAAFILGVEGSAVDRASSSQPRSCLLT